MKPKGTIFSSKKNNLSGEVKVSLSNKQKYIYKKLRLFGAILFSLSLTSLMFFYGPSLILQIRQFEKQAIINAFNNQEASDGNVQEQVQAQEEVQVKEEVLGKNIDVNKFSIHIPAINATSKVVYNVDPFNKQEYLEALKQGVAHAKDTSLPGRGGKVFLFAHSTDSPLNFAQYNAVFYQLRLLEENDEIILSLNDEDYKYKVIDKTIVSPSETSWLTEDKDKDLLVLQTCDPPGTTLKRLIILAQKV